VLSADSTLITTIYIGYSNACSQQRWRLAHDLLGGGRVLEFVDRIRHCALLANMQRIRNGTMERDLSSGEG